MMNKEIEEIVEEELRLPKDTVAKYKSMKKDDLLNTLFVLILRNHVASETIEGLEKEITRHKDSIHTLSDNLRQAKLVIDAIMSDWRS